METHEQKTPLRDVFFRTVAVLGLVAVLLLGAWGIIQLAVGIPTLFGYIGGNIESYFSGSGSASPTAALTVSAPATSASGQTITVSWTDSSNTNGQYSYALSYACASGLSIKVPLPTGSYQTLACNTPANYINATQNMTVIPTFTGSGSAPLILTVSATKLATGAITSSGSATATITSGVAAQTATTQTTAASTVYHPAVARAALYGYPNLAVNIISAIPSGSLTQVTFVIKNNGTNLVPAGWAFNATLPINGGYTFASQPQQALYPGDKVVYTLSYSNTGGQYSYGSGYNNYYYNNGVCYTYNGVANYPTPCTGSGYVYPYTSNYNNSAYNYNNTTGSYTGSSGYTCSGYLPCFQTTPVSSYNQAGVYGYNGGNTVTITADPLGQVLETTKADNTAVLAVPVY